MTLIRNAWSAIREKAPNIERPSLSTGGSGLFAGGGGASHGMVTQMRAMADVGWLFAVVNRIASAVAATEWKLYSTRGGERSEIARHPMLDLWRAVNPFYTQEEFLETTEQHLDLTGEAWWILLRNGRGIPQEIWPVRPDRMKPIPHAQDFVSGYVYSVAGFTVKLDREDVIFIRLPHPLDPYRGMGPVQSILADLQSDRDAAAYERAFYRNSALPGGFIETSTTMEPRAREALVEQFREDHQGVANAWRVSLLEGATWKDRAMLTQRDMQFEQVRRFHRDQILGAFGMPLSVMGITESVNRANAEAGELNFARWILVPRLRRIRAAVNERLVPLFGDELELDFIDPTPEHEELLIDKSERLYNAGVATLDESRQWVGLGPAQVDGDLYKPVEAPVTLSLTPRRIRAPVALPAVEDAMAVMERNMARRLAEQRDEIIQEFEAIG